MKYKYFLNYMILLKSLKIIIISYLLAYFGIVVSRTVKLQNITVHHRYSHLARRYSSFSLQIPDVTFW